METIARGTLGVLVHTSVSKAIPALEQMQVSLKLYIRNTPWKREFLFVQVTSNMLWAPIFVSLLVVLRDAYDKLPPAGNAFTVDGLHLYIAYRRILAVLILFRNIAEHHNLQRALSTPRAVDSLKVRAV